MVTGTRSGWTAAAGHVNKPDLNVLTAAQQQAFYRRELAMPNNLVQLRDFVKPRKLTMYSNAGNVSKKRAEKAFFHRSALSVDVGSNHIDKLLIDARTDPLNPVADGYPDMETFVRSFQSRRVVKLARAPSNCLTYNSRPSLERWAKSCGEIDEARHRPTQNWVESLGPIIKTVCFFSKSTYPSHPSLRYFAQKSICDLSANIFSFCFSLLPPYEQPSAKC